MARINFRSPQAQGLQFWLPGTKDRVRDLGPGALAVTQQNGAKPTVSIYGRVIDFTATDANIVVPHNPRLSLGNNATISHWVRADAPTGYQMMALKRAAGGTVNYETYLNGNDIRFFNGGSEITWGASITTGRWTLLTYTIAGTAVDLYVDGRLAGSTQTLGGTLTPNTEDFTFSHKSGLGGWLPGLMRDLRLYNRTMTRSEAWALWDPRTRYDLWFVRSRRVAMSPGSSAGAITIEPTPLTAAATVVAPVVLTGQRVEPAALSTTATLVAPQVLTGQLVSLTPLTTTAVVVAPEVRAGQQVLPSPLGATATVTTATLVVGQRIEPSALQATAAVVAPSVVVGVRVELSVLTATATLVAPAVSSGGGVALDALTVTATLVTPQANTGWVVSLAPVPATATVVAPEVRAGSVVSLTPVPATATVVAPLVRQGADVTLTPLAVTATLVAPEVRAGQLVTLPSQAVAATLVAPEVRTGQRILPTPITSQGTVVAPQVSSGGLLLHLQHHELYVGSPA